MGNEWVSWRQCMSILLSQPKFRFSQGIRAGGGFRPLSPAGFAGTLLHPVGPTNEFSCLAFEVGLLDLVCVLFCSLFMLIQTLLCTRKARACPHRPDTGSVTGELWRLPWVRGEPASQTDCFRLGAECVQALQLCLRSRVLKKDSVAVPFLHAPDPLCHMMEVDCVNRNSKRSRITTFGHLRSNHLHTNRRSQQFNDGLLKFNFS